MDRPYQGRGCPRRGTGIVLGLEEDQNPLDLAIRGLFPVKPNLGQ